MPTPINISASRGAAILGLSKWSTPVESWLQIMESREPRFCEKRGYVMPEFEYSSAMRWGHAFEGAIIELAESNKNNYKIIDREKVFFAKYNHKKMKKTISCHVDGIYKFNGFQSFVEDKITLHEGKTTNIQYYRENFGEPGTDQVPIEYQVQCQHQMICTGAEKVILSVLVFPKRVEEWEEMGWKIKYGNNETFLIKDTNEEFGREINPERWSYILDQMGYFHQYEITANAHLQNLMIEHYTKFWENNVLKGIEPEPQSYDDIKALCPEPIGTIIADDYIERQVNEYKMIKKEISTAGPLAKRADQIKVDVLNYMRKNGKIVDDDSKNKYILRDSTGRRIASYGKNKNGHYVFR